MAIALTISITLLALAIAGCGLLHRLRNRAVAQRDRLSEELTAAHSANAQLDKDLAVVRQKLEDDQRRIEQFQNQIDTHLKALTSDALAKSTDEFLKLAKQVFTAEHDKAGKQLETNRQAIEGLVKPVRESLDKYQQALQQSEKTRNEAYGSLAQQAKALAEDQRRLREQTASLVTALRRPEVRGRWGEMQLQRVVELAGMIEYVDFEQQQGTDGGRLRPDMVVRLPSDRRIVVDAKTPLDAYLEAAESPDDESRAACLKRHADQINTQVGNLARKEYQQQFDRTPDFVVMFIPGESFLQAAVQVQPGLIEQAMQKNVVIATPSTLMTLLRAVAMGWREQALAENAQKISDVGRELYRRLNAMFSHLGNLNKAIAKTNEHYNKLIGSLESNVLPQARRMNELGVEAEKPLGQKQLSIEVTPREPTSPEAQQAARGADDA